MQVRSAHAPASNLARTDHHPRCRSSCGNGGGSVALQPDAIVTSGRLGIGPVLQAAPRAVPIVFVQVVDPLGGGFVESLAHPGGNATSFNAFEYSLSAKFVPPSHEWQLFAIPREALGSSNGGAIVTVAGTGFCRDLMACHRLPTVYPCRYHVADGGLISYGPVPIDLMRRAAGYLDRILKGEAPAHPHSSGPNQV